MAERMTSIPNEIRDAIRRATASDAEVESSRAVGGGSIADSQLLTMSDGRQWFVKRSAGGEQYPGLFEAEYRALMLLNEPGVIRVPRPLASAPDFLVMEAFRRGNPAADWQERMGRQLARLHWSTRHDSYGFDGDNYLGTSPQPNGWYSDWIAFWRERRLGWQLTLYGRQAAADDPVLVLGERLMECLEDRLAAPAEPAVLLHGDLWSGNAAADETGQPVIYDPASYYGHREAEFGMMRLFGGFTADCETAYQEIWPLADGYEERIPVYRLYHELNHLNLFGAMYHSSCVATLRALV